MKPPSDMTCQNCCNRSGRMKIEYSATDNTQSVGVANRENPRIGHRAFVRSLWPPGGLCEADLVERISAVTLLDRLHEAQNQFYGGGDGAALTELLTSDVAWSVPGNNRIAGSYHGLAEVFAYFWHRRDLAGATFRMHRKDILVGEGRRLAALTDGTATLAGRARQWSTVGLYDVTEQGRIAACWLLPLEQGEFDAIWSSGSSGGHAGLGL